MELLTSAMGGKSRAGKAQLLKYLKGGKLTRQGAIKAKCYDCDGMGESGSCDIKDCSLYPYSSFKE